ncbi:glutathione S-transferase family protein [Humitalea sp. 24SJ18S-53]|uniref:glutathione S-transferase family protein n=1 Tax=Humitalea sp. 24SJ18S-53 TaxID=3422307 RepID=UPI003D67586F
MALTLYYLSGSPYAWRVWLALEHKGIPFQCKTMSYDAGDLKTPGYAALNPRRQVPVIDDDGFVLYESAAIVEYLEDKWPDSPRLFSPDLRQRAIERRLIREADAYFVEGLEHLVRAVFGTPPERHSPDKIKAAWHAMRSELALWESLIRGDWLAGDLSAADYTLFPEIALGQRIAQINPGMLDGDLPGPRLAAWMARMTALPIIQKTWPPHWKPAG